MVLERLQCTAIIVTLKRPRHRGFHFSMEIRLSEWAFNGNINGSNEESSPKEIVFMKNNLLRIIGSSFYSLGMLYASYICIETLSPYAYLDRQSLMVTTFIFLVLMFSGFACSYSTLKDQHQKKLLMRVTLFSILFFYGFLMLDILFFGRFRGFEWVSVDTFASRLRLTVNWVPFRTISNYMSSYARGFTSRNVVIDNIIGNVVIFIPTGILMPLLFKGLRRILPFTGIIFLTVCCVEVFQFISGTGSFDVDDIILNVFGALLGWWIHRVMRALKRKVEDGKKV